MNKIRIAIAGIGNCASSLIQGLHYYAAKSPQTAVGLMHWEIAGYRPHDIEVVAAFDIDSRKVGFDVSDAIFAKPNCTTVFCGDIQKSGVTVTMGSVLDGYSAHMEAYPADRRFLLSKNPEAERADIVNSLRTSRADMLLNFLPVGSSDATEFYATCALEAEVGFVNNIPVFIASDPVWAKRFEDAGLPVIGDDIKAQAGATIIHRALVDLFKRRGVELDRTYQLNVGGNTDFLNMLNQQRLTSKSTSKLEAVQSVAADRLSWENIHVGPSDYIPWQNDNKVCFLRMEGRLFGDVPMNLELRLSVEDSPNSAGVVIDAIRCVMVARQRGHAGVLHGPASYLYKHPPSQVPDDEAYRAVETFIAGDQ